MTGIPDIAPMAEEAEKRKRGWPAGKPRGGPLSPASQVIKPIDQQDIRDGVAAYDRRMALGNPVDKFVLVAEILAASGMISSGATPNSPNKPKEKTDGSLTLEIPSAPHGDPESVSHLGPCEARP
jgi:hypothetical protein